MKAINNTVKAKRGSNVTLKCSGRMLHPLDTEVIWKFNGHKIKDDSNNILSQGLVIFSLDITKVSAKDVGKYTCLAWACSGNQNLSDEDFIELSLREEGEFYFCYIYNNFL